MNVDDIDFKQIEKIMANTRRSLVGLMLEEELLQGWVDDPQFGHRKAELGKHLTEIQERISNGKAALRELQEKVTRGRADHVLDQSRKRVADIVSATPNVKKWLSRLRSKEDKDEP